jgi:hypothetical protein
MSEVIATFKSNYSESRHWSITDQGRDPNAPPVIFDGYLAPSEVTPQLSIYSGDGIYGEVAYQRSDGPLQVGVSVTDGSETLMD